MNDAPTPPEQPRNPLHGVTLEAMVRALEAHFGWAGLAQQIPIRCFTHDPSIPSSLKFLRKTPWARDKVEGLYLFMIRQGKRAQRHQARLYARPEATPPNKSPSVMGTPGNAACKAR